MVRAEGLASLSMRSLGERVGMRAQSLYSYFANKDALLDALFRDANEQLLTWMRPVVEADAETDPIGYLRAGVRRHFEFCVVDPVRYELLFQRTLPGFTPKSLLPEAANHAGVPFAQLVDRLVKRAHARGPA